MGICRREFTAGLIAGLAARCLPGAARPKLLVILVLEQFRPDYIDLLMPQMSPGGFRKLLDKSAVFPDCRHLASGFTSTALATLATGAWPAQHGIVADSWYDRATKTRIHASDETLLAGTVISEAAESNCNVSSVALNPMQARLFAGTQKADFYWMDDRGQFQTNGDAPLWLQPYNERKPLDKLHDARWLVPGARADAPALRTLTYDPRHPEQFLAIYKASPFAQDSLFDFVEELITDEGLGQKSSQDVLCVIESSTELLGYETGARSPLMEQLVLHLDRRVEALLAQLTKSHGDAGFNLVVTGAHGAPDALAAGTRARMAVDGEALARKVDTALAARGLGRVEKYLYPFLYLDSTGFRDAEEIRKAAGHVLLDQPQVADYFTAEGASSAKNGWQGRMRNSFHSRRSGDVMVSYPPGYVENFGQGRGISYGSLYNYDACVPLYLYGPQFRAGIFDRTVEAVDLAPTLARVLGVADPSSGTGRVLAEALA